jgi:hypothetical protein
VETKFRDLSTDVLGATQANAALQTLWRLEEAEHVGPALELLTVER